MDSRATEAATMSSHTTGRASTSHTRTLNARRSRWDKTLLTLKSTCVATLRDLFVRLGHSQRIVNRISTNLRASLIGCYWVLLEQSTVGETPQSIWGSKYLLYLFEADRYAPSTVIMHWTSIASVLQCWKYDPAIESCIRALLHNFQLARPVQWKMMPQWNLHLILSALLWPPFSNGAIDRPSDDIVDQKWLMLKTTFLGSVCQAHSQPKHLRSHQRQSEGLLDWLLWVPLEQIRRVLSEKMPQCIWSQ